MTVVLAVLLLFLFTPLALLLLALFIGITVARVVRVIVVGMLLGLTTSPTPLLALTRCTRSWPLTLSPLSSIVLIG